MELNKGGTVLSKDARPIAAIVWDGPEYFRVGQSDVTAIEAYDESGHMAPVPWIAVFKGDVIVCRVQADHVTISYV